MEFAETKVSRQEISGGQTMAQTAAGFEIAGHGVHHALALLGGQFREHRQGQAGESGLLAFRKFTLLVAQAGKALLQVHGQRVIHLAADLVFLQVLAQAVPFIESHYKLVEDVSRLHDRRRLNPVAQPAPGEQAGVVSGRFLTLGRPGIQQRKLDAQDRRMNGIQTEVASQQLVIVLGVGAVAA